MPGQKKRPEAEEELRRDKRPVDGTPILSTPALPRSSGRFAFPPTYSADNQPVKAFSRAMSGAQTMRGFKIAHGALGQRIRAQERACRRLEVRLAALPERVLVKAVMDEEEIVKFGPEAKHLTDTIKMVAYRAETALVRWPRAPLRQDRRRRPSAPPRNAVVERGRPPGRSAPADSPAFPGEPAQQPGPGPRVRETQRARASVPGNEPDWSMRRRCCINSGAHVRSPEFSGASWAARGRSGVYSPPSPPGRTGA
jgi:hypothetical protein